MKNKVNELEVKNRLKELRTKENLSLNKLKKILKETYDISVSDSQLMYYEMALENQEIKKYGIL